MEQVNIWVKGRTFRVPRRTLENIPWFGEWFEAHPEEDEISLWQDPNAFADILNYQRMGNPAFLSAEREEQYAFYGIGDGDFKFEEPEEVCTFLVAGEERRVPRSVLSKLPTIDSHYTRWNPSGDIFNVDLDVDHFDKLVKFVSGEIRHLDPVTKITADFVGVETSDDVVSFDEEHWEESPFQPLSCALGEVFRPAAVVEPIGMMATAEDYRMRFTKQFEVWTGITLCFNSVELGMSVLECIDEIIFFTNGKPKLSLHAIELEMYDAFHGTKSYNDDIGLAYLPVIDMLTDGKGFPMYNMKDEVGMFIKTTDPAVTITGTASGFKDATQWPHYQPHTRDCPAHFIFPCTTYVRASGMTNQNGEVAILPEINSNLYTEFRIVMSNVGKENMESPKFVKNPVKTIALHEEYELISGSWHNFAWEGLPTGVYRLPSFAILDSDFETPETKQLKVIVKSHLPKDCMVWVIGLQNSNFVISGGRCRVEIAGE